MNTHKTRPERPVTLEITTLLSKCLKDTEVNKGTATQNKLVNRYFTSTMMEQLKVKGET